MNLSPASRSLLILTSLNLLDYLDRYLIAALGTLVKGELDLSDKAFGFLGTAFFLVYFLSSPLFGYLGDRWGKIRLMAGGAVLWSLATSLTYWVASYPALVLARGAVGVGEASFGTLAPAYLADLFPLSRRARALGIFYVAIPVGSALAYLCGGFVGGQWGWRPAFLLAGLPGIVLAAFIYRLPVVESFGSGLKDFSQPATPKTENPKPETVFNTALALWRLPTLKRVTLGYGMVTFTLGGLAFWMPRYLEVDKGLSLAQANYLLFGAVTLAGGLGTLTGGFLGDRLLRRTLGAPLWVSGLGVTAALPLAALAIFSANPYFYVPGLVGAVFLLFLNPGVITAVVVSVAGPMRRAQAVALNIVVIHLVGDVPSPFIIGWASDLWSLRTGVSLTLAGLAAGAILFFLALPHLPRDLAAAGEGV
ncbi:MAG: MFS transporter [Deltaproteobacteria bacterium]|nr:MFS transporter [Deltaproteobacteria bacterium]